MKLVYKGKEIQIDRWFLPFFKALPWYFDQHDYLVTTQWDAKKKKTGKRLKLHRLILLLENSKQLVDHINRDSKDNRLKNLRPSTHTHNLWNTRLSKRNKVGFTGVCWVVEKKKYRAEIRANHKRKHLGYFNTAKQAAEAYQIYRSKREKDGRI